MVGLDNLRTPEVEVVYIEAGIYHGGELLVQERFTQEVPASTYPRWNQWLVFDAAVKNLPKVGPGLGCLSRLCGLFLLICVLRSGLLSEAILWSYSLVHRLYLPDFQ